MRRSLRSALLVVAGITLTTYCVADTEQITFYPAYGYQDGGNWVISMRIWAHEPRDVVEKVTAKITSSMEDLTPKECTNFAVRIQDFLMDSESGEEVTFEFDNDPERKVYGYPNDFDDTDLNGLVKEAVIRIPIAKALELLARQNSRDGWLTYRATSEDHVGTGKVRLLEPTGTSVISDIDDTIKITDIPAGVEAVILNTFFRDFAAAPGMAERYQSWKGAAFHYVSGSPWQLYGPLSEFLFNEAGFPEGTFHMKQITTNPLSMETWESLEELVSNEDATFDQKLTQITEIMQRFPERRFILVGDSGEKDPETYREIREHFPNQVQEIIIRDVVNDKARNPARLEGMTIIDVAVTSSK